MADLSRYAQLQPFSLFGSGASLGDTSIVLSSFYAIDGTTPLTMSAYFGDKGFATIEPNAGTQEEQIVFTGITQNANGTATLTGVSTVDFLYPYTETSGLAKDHAGGVQFVITNTSGFYNRLTNKVDDETISGDWTFSVRSPTSVTELSSELLRLATIEYVNNTATSGAANGSEVVNGLWQGATIAQQAAGTTTGSTGANLTVMSKNSKSTTVGAADATKNIVANGAGFLDQTWLDTARTWGAVQSFTADNLQITTDPNSANDATRQSYVTNLVSTSVTTGVTTFAFSATSGEAITIGDWVYIKASDGKAWRTDADADESTYSVAGVAVSTVGAADLSVSIARSGAIVTGLSGLTAGSYYFLSGTTGAIATSVGARIAKVAQALSTTSLRVIEPTFIRTGVVTVTSATTFPVTTGFYPALIEVRAAPTGASVAGGSIGDNTNRCVQFALHGATDYAVANASQAWNCYDTNGPTTASSGTITSVTQTGFTFTAANYTADTELQWTAYST